MQNKYQDRVLFLKEFTKHLILNSRKEIVIILPREEKIITPFLPVMPRLTSVRTTPFERTEKKLTIELDKPGQTSRMQPRFIQKPRQINPQFIPAPRPVLKLTPQTQEIQPQASPVPQGFELGKINLLINDPRVSVIECSGPEKLILARIYGQPSVTKISLSEQEIREIISRFSKTAKIPVLGGLFKVAVGNLLITAVASDLVGSRFIISKLSPQLH